MAKIVTEEFDIGEGRKAIVAIKRVHNDVKAKWLGLERSMQINEKRRIAVMRRDFTKDEMPELYERPKRDVDGNPVSFRLEDPHVGKDGEPVMIEVNYSFQAEDGSTQTVPIEVQAMRPRLDKDKKPILIPVMEPVLQTGEFITDALKNAATIFADSVVSLKLVTEREGTIVETTEHTDATAIFEALEDFSLMERVGALNKRIQNLSARQAF